MSAPSQIMAARLLRWRLTGVIVTPSGQWLAGPFDTFAEADAAREPARRKYRAGQITPAVVAIRPL